MENAKQQAILMALKSQVSSDEAHIHLDLHSLRYLLLTVALNVYLFFVVLLCILALRFATNCQRRENMEDRKYCLGPTTKFFLFHPAEKTSEKGGKIEMTTLPFCFGL